MYTLRKSAFTVARSLPNASRFKHTLPQLPYAYDALQPIISKEIMEIHHTKHHATYITNLNAAEEQLQEAVTKNDTNKIIQLQPALRFNGGGHINHSIFWHNLSPNGGKPSDFPEMLSLAIRLVQSVDVCVVGGGAGANNTWYAVVGGLHLPLQHAQEFPRRSPSRKLVYMLLEAGFIAPKQRTSRAIAKMRAAERYDELCKIIDSSFGSFDIFKSQMAAKTTAIQGSGWGWLAFNPTTCRLEIVTCANQDPLNATTGLVPLLGIDVWEHAYYLQYKNVRADYVKAVFDIVNWNDVSKRLADAKK